MSTEDDLVLSSEVAELAQRRKGRVHEIVGSRSAVTLDQVMDLVPDLTRRDVYVAAPEGFVQLVVASTAHSGVPRDAVHFEEYALG